MADEPQTTETPDEAPYAPPAPGRDRDSRKRELKARLASAETSGDTDAADSLRKELDAINEELAAAGRAGDHEAAAAARKATAEASGSDAATSPPQGRAAPAKVTTKAATTKG